MKFFFQRDDRLTLGKLTLTTTAVTALLIKTTLSVATFSVPLQHSSEDNTFFTYLMCGDGTPPLAPIRWYGSTRELAYMVRTQLNSNWL